MFNVSFCSITPHYQVKMSFRETLKAGTFIEVPLHQKGKIDRNSGRFDILEFSDEHLSEWLQKSKGLDSQHKKSLALHMYESFKQEVALLKKKK